MTGFIQPSSVFVIGASGYIGLGVARAFRKAGYFVYGLIRDEKKRALLLAHEISPVVGDAASINTYEQYIKACPVIVDCSSSLFDEDGPTKRPLAVLKAVSEASKHRDRLLPLKTFIYTSGIMVYGNDPRIRDEAWPIGKSTYAEFRRTVEEAVTLSPDVFGIVIRPAWVFGGSGGPHADMLFNPDKLILKGTVKDRRYSWIHIDDLGESYVLACNKASTVRGYIFNISNNYDAPVLADLVVQGSKLAGYKGELHWEPNKGWQDELADATVLVNCLQATTLLGFVPKIFGLQDNLEFYYQCHKASKAIHHV